MSKSVFGWYAIWRALKDNPRRTVIYQSHKLGTRWIRRHGAPIVESSVSEGLALPDLKDPHTLFVTDAIVPGAYECVTLLITSPKPLEERGKEFLKSAQAKLHWPIYTEDEIWDLHHVAFPALDRGKVAKRLALWGPNPRAVLGRITSVQQRQAWVKVAALKPELVEDALESPFSEKREEPTHRLIHVYTAGQSIAAGSTCLPCGTSPPSRSGSTITAAWRGSPPRC